MTSCTKEQEWWPTSAQQIPLTRAHVLLRSSLTLSPRLEVVQEVPCVCEIGAPSWIDIARLCAMLCGRLRQRLPSLTRVLTCFAQPCRIMQPVWMVWLRDCQQVSRSTLRLSANASFGNFALNLPLPPARALEALSGPASKLSCPGTRPVDFRRGGLPAQAQIEPAQTGTRPFQLVCPCPVTAGVLIDCLCVQGDLPACQLLTTEGNLIERRARLAEGQVVVVAAAFSPGEAPDLASFCATPQALRQLLGKGIPSSVRRCLLHCQDGWAADDQIAYAFESLKG